MSSGIASTIAIVGNAIVIYIIVTRKTLRNSANFFISSLAASDLGVGFSSFVQGAYLIASDQLPREGALQEACDFISSVFYTASVLNLCLMSVDRYIAIAFPYKYMAVMSHGRVAFLVSLCWLVPVLTSLTPLIWIRNDDEQRWKANSVFYPIVSLLFVITSYLILIPATLHVYLITRKHFNRITAVNLQLKFNHGCHTSFRARDISTSKLLMIAAVMFILCYSVHLFQEICDLCCDLSFSSELTVFLLLLNSAVNPFVYSFHKRDIRRELKRLFIDVVLCEGVKKRTELIVRAPTRRKS